MASAAALEPLDRPLALGEQVYHTLRAHVREGRIGPGEPLQEVQIATRLGVSRTPVREALARLASEGLLVSGGRSFMVPALTLADVDDIYEIRLLIEPAAMARVAPLAADPQVRAPMEDALAAAIAAHARGNGDDFRAANTRFHAAWLALVPNARMLKMIEQYSDHMRRTRALTLDDPAIRRIVMEGFEAIVAAMRAGDGEAAAAAMRAHLLQARRAFVAAVGLETNHSDSH